MLPVFDIALCEVGKAFKKTYILFVCVREEDQGKEGCKTSFMICRWMHWQQDIFLTTENHQGELLGWQSSVVDMQMNELLKYILCLRIYEFM